VIQQPSVAQRPSVVCLSTYFPWPADAGGSLRVAGFVRALSQEFDVRVFVPQERDAATTAKIVADVEREQGITVELYGRPYPGRSRLAAAALWARCAVVGIPPWIYGNLDRALVARYTELAAEVDAIVLLEDFMGLYPLTAGLTVGPPVVADKHVVLGRPRSEADLAAAASRSLADRFKRRLTKNFERRYLATVRDVVMTTPEEKVWLHTLYGREATAVIPTGIDLTPVRPPRPTPRRSVGWLSALDVEDNVSGLTRFLETAWPSLAAAGYVLHVAGRNPTPAALRLGEIDGVDLIGPVESAQEFMADVDVAVIPLWSGRGIKVKTLTWMSAGVPVVATPMALEGMAVADGHDCLVGDTPEELAAHVRTLLEDPDLADRVAAQGREFVADAFTWDAVGPQFVAVVQQAVQAGRQL
jgi:polysaccharide biosynthesis protein PslH